MTKKEMFNEIANVIAGLEVENKAEMLEFIDKQVKMLEKRSSKSGQTAKQKENEVLKVQLVECFKALKGEKVTVTEFQSKFPQFAPPKFSNQKMSAMFSQLIKAGVLNKKVEKKKSYFFLVESEVVGE